MKKHHSRHKTKMHAAKISAGFIFNLVEEKIIWLLAVEPEGAQVMAGRETGVSGKAVMKEFDFKFAGKKWKQLVADVSGG